MQFFYIFLNVSIFLNLILQYPINMHPTIIFNIWGMTVGMSFFIKEAKATDIHIKISVDNPVESPKIVNSLFL